ncbi:hypothetical protein MNEG_3986 [Monoraphidium neglectum]|uniref:Uncharacterized protein n=1 Tax=Monoraphidium neglectum TaxID=145388 RepID=A0A0D2MTZ4_9CHLO|nr:hypothetical protein MNEG_3986 [Monoraphidium neglectum]KIZ03967.1 hypothetical protein MNEG_3986 [Monoraphidium neglectum]|eukprot:XP_013902986.1 hypothetical protein MNEG_3986 [Monoraphidium neglectum]
MLLPRQGQRDDHDGGASSGQPPPFARLLSPALRRRWLLDCLRWRMSSDIQEVEDDLAVSSPWGAWLLLAGAKGLARQAIVEQLLVFCQMIHDSGLLPHPAGSGDGGQADSNEMDWAALLAEAASVLPRRFEVGPECMRWRDEAPSLRGRGDRAILDEMSTTFHLVEARACAPSPAVGLMVGPHAWLAMGAVSFTARLNSARGRLMEHLASNPNGIFDDVGGAAAWQRLYDSMGEPQLFG